MSSPRHRRWSLASLLTALIGAFILITPLAASAQSLSVYPHGQAATEPLSSGPIQLNFGVSGTQANTQYYIDLICDGTYVTNCSTSLGQSHYGQFYSVPVNIWTGATAGSGRVRVRVYASGYTPSDSGWFNVSVHELTPPTISLMQPASGYSEQHPTIQIGWCDNTSLNAGTRWIKVNGTDVTTSFDYNTSNGPSGCGASASSTTTSVALNLGTNTVQAYICDNWSNCTTSNTWNINVSVPTITLPSPSPSTVFTQYPQLQVQWCDNESLNSGTRWIKVNGNDVTASFDYNSPGGGGCTYPATSTTSSVSLNLGANTIQAYICDNWNNCTTQSFTVTREAVAAVALANHNRDNLDRGLCLTVSAGDGAEVNCGDLVAYHAMPGFKTMNVGRNLELVYNSATARPKPRIAAQVTLGAGDVPQNVFAKLVINSATQDSAWFSTSGWSASTTRQVVLAFDASTFNGGLSGIYPFSFTVRFNYSGGFNDITVNDTLLLVNRSGSEFGAGWYLSGVERLALGQPNNTILWMGGDGSAKKYDSVAVGQWLAAKGSYRDSILRVGSNYERHGQHGVTITFNGFGQHVQTKNRLGHVSTFNWPSNRLTSIVLPPASSTYQLKYDGSANLDTIIDPAGRVLAASVSGAVLTQLKDPDNAVVSFAYDGEKRLTSRTNRRGAVNRFYYDNDLRVTRVGVQLDSLATQVATTTFTNWDELGLGLNNPRDTITPVDPTGVRTLVDGARAPSDVKDTTAFYLDRFGAPIKIVNARGDSTLISRGDTAHPALPTQMRSADGFITRAGYDAHGNLVSDTALNPLNNGLNTGTRYHWDTRWDFADSVITPTGIVTTFKYDSTNGNRLWQQLGADSARRVRFNYGNSLKLLSSTLLPQTPADSLEYDAQGNLSAARTPLGYWTSYYADGIGRDTLIVTPIDSADKSRGGTQDATARLRQLTYFTAMNRDWSSASIGPNGAEQISVSKSYDAEGNLKSLARASVPDLGSIGTVTTQWRYDFANRRVAEVAPDGAVDSTAYDSVGNVKANVTRRSNGTGGFLTITMSYDALNRLMKRQLPQVTYASRPTAFTISTAHQNTWNIGAYAADTIPADSLTFTYDAMGRILTANNADAKVKRTYYPNGLLQTDSSWIQTVNRNDWSKHVYGVTHRYDLENRDTSIAIPHQLGFGADTTITRAYDASLGVLTSMHDLQQNVYGFYYDLRGEADSLAYPGSYSEWMRYDADGRLKGDTIRNFGSGSWPRPPSPYVRATTYQYDARGKLLLSGDVVHFRDSVSAVYTGLGNLQSTLWIQHGCQYCDLDTLWTAANYEVHSQDALANRTLTSIVSQQVKDPNNYNLPPNSYDTLRYQAGVGRLTFSHAPGSKARTYYYDQAGDIEFESAIAPADSAGASAERASFFAADGTLRMVDSRWAENAAPYFSQHQQYVVEDYRYDALGRRIWMRSLRLCGDYSLNYQASTECKVGFVRRTIWDGDQELAEIQSPWTIEGWVQYDTAYYRALADSDVTPMNFSYIETADGIGGDPNKLFGHVVYAGFRGMDHPMAITRVNYAWIMDWYNPQATKQSSAQVQPPFTIIPFWDMKGDAQQGVMATGERTLCSQPSSFIGCVATRWPWDFSSADRQRNLLRPFWHGSLLESKRDKSGLGYSRNRYYDPNTGRFTQEDPVGLAGGLNVYAYANGDPVNLRDPFGLSADTIDYADSTMRDKAKNCREKSTECASMLDSLKRSTEYWQISRGRPGDCLPFIVGCTHHDPVPGHGEGGTVRIIPGEFGRAHIFVNSVAALGHELGHALYDREPVCASDEHCAINVEQTVREQAGLPRRP